MNIVIKNCSNIERGDISIQEGVLNIKYATNGTGKTTIAKAITASFNPDEIKDLIPYKHLAETPLLPEHKPDVRITPTIHKLLMFNEDYVNNYVFLPSDLLSNSFEILIKTENYDRQMATIQNLIHEIKNTFKNNSELEQLTTKFTAFIEGFGRATKSGYSKASSIGKGIANGNKVLNIPPELEEYSPFIQSENNAAWIAWQSKGADFLDITEKCPYCASGLASEQKTTVKKVAVEYDAKYITELQKMSGVFLTLENYLIDSSKLTVETLNKKATAFGEDEINFLIEIKGQVDILNQKLLDLYYLDFGSLKDVDKMIDALQTKKINLALLSHLNSQSTREKIEPLNIALDKVLEKAGELQGAVNIQKDEIRRTIAKYSQQINGFLESAGYKYNVKIETDTEKKYQLKLFSTECDVKIENVKSHLSYGERNAFALVLFMYQALKDNPDIIVLDDPISSFDKNKKYAILEKLFQGAESLQGKTVVMLTHDFDPIVDLIHTTSIRCRFCPVPVASFLTNQNGQLSEKEIKPNDVKSFFEIANEKLSSDIDIINKLIYLRRKFEATGQKGLAWQLLSNIFHPDREVPIIQDHEHTRDMTPDEIQQALMEIGNEIPTFTYDYESIYSRAHDTTEIIRTYKLTTSGYEKVQLYRLINHGNINDTVFKKFVDETYHIENDGLFQLDPSEYPTIPEYIVELCDNGIELIENSITNE